MGEADWGYGWEGRGRKVSSSGFGQNPSSTILICAPEQVAGLPQNLPFPPLQNGANDSNDLAGSA